MCNSVHTFSNKPELGSPFSCSLLVLVLGAPCEGSGHGAGRRAALLLEHQLGCMPVSLRGTPGDCPFFTCVHSSVTSSPLACLQRERVPRYSPASGLASQCDRYGARVQRSLLCPLTCGSGRADTGLTPVALNVLVGVPQAHVSAAGAWVGSCCSVLPGTLRMRPGLWGISGKSGLPFSKGENHPRGQTFAPAPASLHGRLTWDG